MATQLPKRDEIDERTTRRKTDALDNLRNAGVEPERAIEAVDVFEDAGKRAYHKFIGGESVDTEKVGKAFGELVERSITERDSARE